MAKPTVNVDNTMITWVQRVALYETKARFFIVGSNNTQTRFRVLKVDRTESKELVVIDDKLEYNQLEIRDLLNRIDYGNRQGKSAPVGSGLNRSMSAFGIFGFVRFLEGYFLILITKRRRVAQIGHHVLYKIEDTSMVYIPSDGERCSSDEVRYQKMFQNVDLSSNFYFSYSYDLSHTLQYNMRQFSDVQVEKSDGKTVWESSLVNGDNGTPNQIRRTHPEKKFVWNEFLLENVDLHPDWLLFATHGFISQSNICVFGKPLYLTLIARRSKKYAGTRFLKRGANNEGDVGNEVETEQIVHDSSISSFEKGKFTSFVQMRGSVPSHWSQDISKMVPKPLIQMDIVDPYHLTAGMHFNQLLSRYGAPIFVLNLVKRRERRPHESVLSNEFQRTVTYLNQFIPPPHAIEHISFDMALVNKCKDSNVMNKLSDIASHCFKKTGIFKSWKCRISERAGEQQNADGHYIQTGTVRVNCVDCLDRTNTAQFAMGKCALALQLQALGVLEKPSLEFDTDSVRMLEEMYEDHGDTLALQYGGSQLVHRIKTYRKIAPISSQSRDIMQTLSRYYSNTFSDADKQNAINVFLGIFKPSQRSLRMPHIWDLQTDFYLHSSPNRREVALLKPFTCWWDERVAYSLPQPADQVFKGMPQHLLHAIDVRDRRDERTDGFYEQYRPFELTVLSETLSFNMLHTEKDFMPHFTTDSSPLRMRSRPGKRIEPVVGKTLLPNPSLSSQVSTSSQSSSPSEGEGETDDGDDPLEALRFRRASSSPDTESLSSATDYCEPRTFEAVLDDPKQRYGVLCKMPETKDLHIYQNYVSFGVNAGEYQAVMERRANGASSPRSQLSTSSSAGPSPKAKSTATTLGKDSCYALSALRPLSDASRSVYANYVNRGKRGADYPSPEQIAVYERYLRQ